MSFISHLHNRVNEQEMIADKVINALKSYSHCVTNAFHNADLRGVIQPDKKVKHIRTCIYTEKTIFPFPFTLNGIWSWGQFSFLILNQMEFHLAQNRKENCHHDHIPSNLKGNGNIVFSVYIHICIYLYIYVCTVGPKSPPLSVILTPVLCRI